MIFGLHVETESGYGAVLAVELGWKSPPPVGDKWWCCRRSDVPEAQITGHTWAGLEDDPDVWVAMRGDRRMVGHLVDKHGFEPRHR